MSPLDLNNHMPWYFVRELGGGKEESATNPVFWQEQGG